MSMIAGRARWVTVTEFVPALRSRRDSAGLLLLDFAAYVALIACAAGGTWVGVAVSAALVLAGETALGRRAPIVFWALRRVQFGAVARAVVAGMALVLFASRTLPAMTGWTVVSLAVIAASGALGTGIGSVVEFLRTPPVITRGLALDLLDVPPAPARILRRPAEAAAATVTLVAAGLVVAVAAGHRDAVAAIGLVLAALAALAVPTRLGVHVLRLRAGRVRRGVQQAIERGLADLAPQVALYFGNDASWRYQVEMWLPVLETVPERVVVVVRDHETLRLMAPTTLPVVSVPRATALMQLPLPGLRAVLYVGNTATNIHFLRRPDVGTAFVGHGDSDKGASFNPITRVYNEIWVAGPAARERYRDAGLDIPDSAFVEVGRPQLRAMPRLLDDRPMLTVLYAPTWEGWGENPSDSSLADVGPELVRALLDRAGVRVMYRPHPQSGHRDPALRRAHAEIVRLLRAAGAREHTGPPPQAVAAGAVDRDLLDALTDPPTAPAAAGARDVERWTTRYWQEHPGHRILTAPAPDLVSCFTRTDVLIADISSVVTDFLAADRPYAIVNPGYVDDARFRQESPSAAGGFVLDHSLAALDGLLAAAGGPDPTARARAAAAQALLGLRPADPAEPFRAAVNRIARSG